MFVIFYIVTAKCCYKVRIVCLISIQIKAIACLSAFFHAASDKMLKECLLVGTKNIRKIRIELQIVLVIIDCLILYQLMSKWGILQSNSAVNEIIIDIPHSLYASIHVRHDCIVHLNVVYYITNPSNVIKATPRIAHCILNFILR